MEKFFTKPNRPFLLLAHDKEGIISYHWLESEEELQEVVQELKENGDTIIDALEIGVSRDIELEETYTVDDFIADMDNVYINARNLTNDFIAIKVYEQDGECHELGFEDDYIANHYDIQKQIYERYLMGEPLKIEAYDGNKLLVMQEY